MQDRNLEVRFFKVRRCTEDVFARTGFVPRRSAGNLPYHRSYSDSSEEAWPCIYWPLIYKLAYCPSCAVHC